MPDIMSLPGRLFFEPALCRYSITEKGAMMEIKSKIWIEVEGKPVFGRGRSFLLEAIDRYGSINHAAKEINISYRKAWGYIKAMEERLGFKLIERQTGGKNGGGAALTDNAREFLRKYDAMEQGIREIVDERFRENFG